MAKPMPEDELAEIEEVVRAHPGGITLGEIAAALKDNDSDPHPAAPPQVIDR